MIMWAVADDKNMAAEAMARLMLECMLWRDTAGVLAEKLEKGKRMPMAVYCGYIFGTVMEYGGR
jgi:hypothetical protein